MIEIKDLLVQDTHITDEVGDFLSFLPNVFVHLSVAKNYTMIDVAATIGGLAAQQFALYSDS